ncbi:hypothetical protein ASC97_29225 [Rhizobium sp. Root1203]|uniref:ArnT family glycosyltransferase n=1 Tax=Rhizobium sp. Root1203 TaxID=1736427 RepID=UPI00070EB7F7|nr:hypothetical protein [Rhizobium sp. Root1203]KQV19483.1 hypothetical protein ASC97_29225 [Rhizobium sp. Root1203]
MIDISFFSLGTFLLVASICTLSGVYLSSAFPWSNDARRVGLVRSTGIALGPFILGFGAVISLGLLHGASHKTHLVTTLGFALLVGGVAYFLRGSHRNSFSEKKSFSLGEWAVLLAIIMGVLELLLVTFFIPLTQNDALEYATAAREVYATRDLLTYPVLNSQTNLSGFYGPWTHPPLYVALLYIADVTQGNSDVPGLIRLISPWFLLCGAYVVHTLGSLVNRVTGLVASLLFLSPPLFFLGAVSALLDPLPVLGFTLVLAVAVGLNARPAAYGGVIGGILGMALWTHSQAILFIPLALSAVGIQWGLRDIKGFTAAALSLLVVAFLIGGWPYLHNIQVFGTPVSDDPAVFAIPSLHWDDYFTIGRGLETTTAMIQYGIFKGWFALESYGFIFWGMAVGIGVFAVSNRSAGIRTLVQDGARAFERRDTALWLMTGLLAVYMLGMVVSVALGIEHMVKNERYLLVTLPIVAVLCAYGYTRVIGLFSRRFDVIHTLLLIVLAAFFTIHFFALTKYSMSRYGSGRDQIAQSMGEKLQKAPEFQLVDFLNKNTPKGSLVLSIKPADMYYSSDRMISYLDVRLLPFYEQTGIGAAYQELRKLGVTHIHVPNYGLPPLYNSQLFALLRDPTYTSLLFQNAAGQVYALTPEKLAQKTAVDISPDKRQWVLQTALSLGGRKDFARSGHASAPLNGSSYTGGLPLDLFHRHWITGVKVGVNALSLLPEGASALSVNPTTQYAVDLSVAGNGFVTVTVDQFSGAENASPRKPINSMQVVRFELSEKQDHRTYGFRFLTDPAANTMALTIESVGSSKIEIEKVTYSELERTK